MNEERTCEFCRWQTESKEGEHCRHCICNATDNFEMKVDEETQLRNDTIDDFSYRIMAKCEMDDLMAGWELFNLLREIKTEMKGE